MKKMNTIIKPLIGILFIGIAAWVSTAFDLIGLFSLDRMTGFVNSLGAFGPVAFICLCIAGVFLHVPEFLVIALGGVIFGGVKGFFYGWIGALTGSAATFLCMRYFMRDTVQASLNGKFKRLDALDARFAEQGFQTVLMLRLILFMAPPMNWLIALTRVQFLQYITASALGLIPGVAVICYCASTIVKARSFSDVLTPDFLLPFALLGALVLASTLAARRLLGSRQEA